MSLSFILWSIISGFLISFWGWTIYVVLNQKRAWKFYADKKKLRFHSNGMLETPSISGAVDGYKVSIFASEHSELDSRSQRRLTAIEIAMHTGLPFHGAIASGGMVPIVDVLDLPQEYKPPASGWDDSYIIRTRDQNLMQKYFTDERVKALIDLMQVEKAWVILLFLGDYGLLRLDTPSPIDNPKDLDKLINQLIAVARELELKDGEAKDIINDRSKLDKATAKLKIDDKLLGDDIGFELED